jgi:hypothetical protein
VRDGQDQAEERRQPAALLDVLRFERHGVRHGASSGSVALIPTRRCGRSATWRTTHLPSPPWRPS